MRRIRHLAVAGSIVALVLGQSLPASASVLIRAKSLACASTNHFQPASVSVAKGTKVVWTSSCGTHTVSSYSKNWSKNTTLAKGQSTSRTFKSAGTFKYRCMFHSTLVNGKCSGMCGKVVVG